MKKIFTILLIGILINSCSTEDNPENNDDDPLIKNIKIDLNYARLWANPNMIDFNFEYDNKKKLVKKTGAFALLPTGSFFYGYFTNDIYTSLLYNDNKVTVEEFSYSYGDTFFKNTNYYTLNNVNQITIREIPNINYNDKYKKQLYEYTNNKLIEIKTTFPNRLYNPSAPNDYILTYSEKFYYDSNGNLSKTEYYEQHNGINKGEKIIRTFENYDMSFNPTKRLFLLNEYFYRSISKNNFRKYTETKYNDYSLINTLEINWIFNYDSSGNIIIN